MLAGGRRMRAKGAGGWAAAGGIGFLLAVLIWSSPATAAQYQVVGIEPPTGYEGSSAWGLNRLGEVVGRFFNIDPSTSDVTDRQAFVWDSINGVRLLPTLHGESGGWHINQLGQASGFSFNETGQQRAARWNVSTNAITDLGALTNTTTRVSGPTSSAYGIDSLGRVVGYADIPDDAGDFTPYHAFLYDPSTGMQDLGTLTTAYPQWANGYSIAYTVNTGGEVVGTALDDSMLYGPFIYDATTGMQALTRDASYPNGEWYAVVINDSGLIGGHVIAATNQSMPFYWPNRSAAPVKLTMPSGFPYGEIYGINSAGVMVGIMWDTDQADATEHAFIFDIQNGVRDLNTLIDSGSGWVLHYAKDISDSGQIVGLGELTGKRRAVLLTPNTLQAPPAAALVWPAGTIGTVPPAYIWNAVAAATSYRLLVDDSTGRKIDHEYTARDASCEDGTGTCSVSPGTALALGAGKWQIQTRNAAGYGPLSAAKAFTVSASMVSLSASRAGSADGTVTSAPAGLDCGVMCIASFTSGTVVTLTAIPASGAVFREWRGACGGVSSTCIFNISGATSVTAVFSKVFTDDHLTPHSSVVKVAHVSELRSAIDTLRGRLGLPDFPWTDSSLSPHVTGIRAVHVSELRSALGQAYQAAGRVVPTYTDSILTPRQTPVKATHLQDLRTAVRALE
jgi:probable HAF family extracellular repeat protein